MLSTANCRNKTSRSDTKRKLGAPCTYKHLQLLPVARIFKLFRSYWSTFHFLGTVHCPNLLSQRLKNKLISNNDTDVHVYIINFNPNVLTNIIKKTMHWHFTYHRNPNPLMIRGWGKQLPRFLKFSLWTLHYHFFKGQKC